MCENNLLSLIHHLDTPLDFTHMRTHCLSVSLSVCQFPALFLSVFLTVCQTLWLKSLVLKKNLSFWHDLMSLSPSLTSWPQKKIVTKSILCSSRHFYYRGSWIKESQFLWSSSFSFYCTWFHWHHLPTSDASPLPLRTTTFPYSYPLISAAICFCVSPFKTTTWPLFPMPLPTKLFLHP